MNDTRPGLLLVEDEPDLRSLWSEYLQRSGWHVRTAASVADVREVLAGGWVPSLALVDWSLPDGDGASVQAHLGAIPVVLCSGDRQRLPESARDRAVGVLQKPFRLKLLSDTLQAALQR